MIKNGDTSLCSRHTWQHYEPRDVSRREAEQLFVATLSVYGGALSLRKISSVLSEVWFRILADHERVDDFIVLLLMSSDPVANVES